MKFTSYLKDKWLSILLYTVLLIIIVLLLIAFKVDSSLLYAILFLFLLFGILIVLSDFYRKKSFYKTLVCNTELLDKKYLVLEMMKKPNFLEGEILWDTMYEINKSMIENVKNYELQVTDFKEYIEMWIHEVKIPISSFLLFAHNHNDQVPKKAVRWMQRVEDYTEQILYYVRSENSEKDYLIKEVELSNVVREVALRNKDYILESKIELVTKNLHHSVYTDSKWLEFILNQIVNNSIKYQKERDIKRIEIRGIAMDNQVKLEIEDNGIGIPASDIPNVFKKSFTGENGRKRSKSTGMGLFIASNLCNKLGHKLEIESEVRRRKVYESYNHVCQRKLLRRRKIAFKNVRYGKVERTTKNVV